MGLLYLPTPALRVTGNPQMLATVIKTKNGRQENPSRNNLARNLESKREICISHRESWREHQRRQTEVQEGTETLNDHISFLGLGLSLEKEKKEEEKKKKTGMVIPT